MLSRRSKYAIKAVLALARGGEQVRIADLARQEQIPKKFLEGILLILRNNGVLQSRKGQQGGYSLGRPAKDIYVGQIVRLLDGPLAPIACASETAYVRCVDCADEAQCGVRIAMRAVRDATADILDHTSIAQLLRQTDRRARRR
jgi:Rrf2 family protein